MRTIPAIAGLCLLALPPGSARAESKLPEKFGAWTRTSCDTNPPAAGLAKEAGDKEGATSCTYSSGNKSLSVWAEKFQDPSAAYEVYTAMLRPGMIPSFIAPNGAVDKQQKLILLTGNLVLVVDSQHLAKEEELRQLVKSLQGHLDQTPLPPIRSYLPKDGLVQGSQRYALGPDGFQDGLKSLQREKFAALIPELGFPLGAEAMMARYSLGRNSSEVVLLMAYPTPQLAEQHLRHIQPLLNSNPELAGTTVERRASLLSFVLAPESKEAASQLHDAIDYETHVTMNEASQTYTDPPWLLVLKNIFIGTFVFCGLAIALGVAFGGLRVVTKRLFPGKVFDRPEDIEVIQLGLSGKRIDPKDFY